MQDRRNSRDDNRGRSSGGSNGQRFQKEDKRPGNATGAAFRKRRKTEGKPLSSAMGLLDKRKDDPNSEVRLNKYLAETGACSRRKADEYITEGKVKVNGNTVSELGAKIRRTDFVTLNGDPVKNIIRLTYILLNKPKDFISTVEDDRGRKTVMDIVKSSDRLFPVGRLDRNSTGVILLTNDGELAYRLTHPKYEIQRTYKVALDKPLAPKDAEAIANGVELEEGSTAPCEIIITPENHEELYITLIEGKNREIRKIFEAFGYIVKRLDRKSYGILNYRGLARGQFRNLEKQELYELKRSVKL